MDKLQIGLDPELLLRERSTKKVVSAIPVIPEGKENPRDLGKGFKVLHDNVLVEFNIPPASTSKQFIANLREGFRRINKVVGKEYELLPQASHHFDKEFLEAHDARRFGCSSEYDAYEMRECEAPDANTDLRSCGSHIHLGRKDFENPSDEVLSDPYSKNRIIQLMDLFVGLPLTLIDKDRTSGERKKLYGRAGRLRPTAYGVEYRTPPNYYLRTPELAELVFDLTKHAVSVENDGKAQEVLEILSPDKVQTAINTSNKKMCAALIKQLPFPNPLKERMAKFNRALPNSLAKWEI